MKEICLLGPVGGISGNSLFTLDLYWLLMINDHLLGWVSALELRVLILLRVLDSFATRGLCVMAPGPWIDIKCDPEHAAAHPWQIGEVVELQLRDSHGVKQGTGVGIVENLLEEGVHSIRMYQVSDRHYHWWLFVGQKYPNTKLEQSQLALWLQRSVEEKMEKDIKARIEGMQETLDPSKRPKAEGVKPN
eukprot:3292268-Amphidinium_carterae.1